MKNKFGIAFLAVVLGTFGTNLNAGGKMTADSGGGDSRIREKPDRDFVEKVVFEAVVEATLGKAAGVAAGLLWPTTAHAPTH